MRVPTINLNGTYGPALLQQYTDAMTAVEQALNAMRAIECHGRDFPPTRDNSNRASEAYAVKMVEVRRLEDLHRRLVHVATEVQDQLLVREQKRSL